MQPDCTAVSTPCHVGRGLAGHPQCVNVGNDEVKMRLYTPIRSSPEIVRLLQPLLPRPQKRRRPVTYSRSQTPEIPPDEKVVQDDHFETYPNANMPRGLVHVAWSKKRVLSHPGSPHHRRFLRFAFEGMACQYKATMAEPQKLEPHLPDVSTLWNGPFSLLGVKTET